MSLGALASTGGAIASMFSTAGTAMSGVAAAAAAHPVLATAVAVGAYELFGGSNNPPHLGNLIDLKV